MPVRKPVHRSRWLLALLLVAALAMTACGNSDHDEASAPTTAAPADTQPGGSTTTAAGSATDEFVKITGVPGVTDEEIQFSAFGTQANNPLGTCVLDCYVDGIEAYFAYRNSEGGIYGRDLKLSTVLDDELANNQVRALEIVSADDTFAAFSATQVASGWGDIVNAGMPLYVWGIHPAQMTGQTAMFSFASTTCIDCTKRPEAFAAKTAGATKVAVLGYGISENSKRSAKSTADSIELYAAEIGAEVAYFNDDIAFGLPNGAGPEVTAMKNAGVDMVFASIDLNGMKTIAQELERQGMGDVPMYHPNTYNQDFVAEAGQLFEGDYVGVIFRPFEADPGDSALADFTKWMEETGSEITEMAMYGWINATTAYDGLVAAGPNFDRAKVIAAMNSIEDYTAGGLVPPLDFGRQHNPPTQEDPATNGYEDECLALVQVKSGKFEVVGDPAMPWSCWSNANRDWSEPTPTDFE